jgi:hypothetical protein
MIPQKTGVMISRTKNLKCKNLKRKNIKKKSRTKISQNAKNLKIL